MLTLVEMVAAKLPADSAIPANFGRMLVTGGPVGSALFRRLHEISRDVPGYIGERLGTTG